MADKLLDLRTAADEYHRVAEWAKRLETEFQEEKTQSLHCESLRTAIDDDPDYILSKDDFQPLACQLEEPCSLQTFIVPGTARAIPHIYREANETKEVVHFRSHT